MFRSIFYPKDVKLYTDNVRATVTNSMSEPKGITVLKKDGGGGGGGTPRYEHDHRFNGFWDPFHYALT